jgi:hypothetical protein
MSTRFSRYGGGSGASSPRAAMYEEQYGSIGTVARPRPSTTPPERFAEAHGYPAGQVVEEETWAVAPTGDEPGILNCFSQQWLQLTALGYARSDYRAEPTSTSSNAALPPMVPTGVSSSVASGRLKTPRSVGLTPRGDQAQPTTSTTHRSSRRSTSTGSTQRTRFRDPPLQLETTSRTSSRGGLRIEMHSPRPKGVGPLRRVWSNVTSAKALFLVRALALTQRPCISNSAASALPSAAPPPYPFPQLASRDRTTRRICILPAGTTHAYRNGTSRSLASTDFMGGDC